MYTKINALIKLQLVLNSFHYEKLFDTVHYFSSSVAERKEHIYFLVNNI